jgi:hypothetical protein
MTEVKPNTEKKAYRAALPAGVIIEGSISYTVQLTQQGHIIRLLLRFQCASPPASTTHCTHNYRYNNTFR